VLTCRTASREQYQSLPPSFSRFQLLDFDWEDICRFIEHWFQEQPAKGKSMQMALEQNPRLQGLLATPLLLALAAIVYQRRGSLPERRFDLYKRCVELLLSEWDATRDKNRFPRFQPEHKEDLLKQIAWHFHIQGKRYFHSDDLLPVIRAYLPRIQLQPADASGILQEIYEHHGLLKQQSDDEYYGFHHFTLQEYFAAAKLDLTTLAHW